MSTTAHLYSEEAAEFLVTRIVRPSELGDLATTKGYYRIQSDRDQSFKYLFFSIPSADLVDDHENLPWPFGFNTLPRGDWNVGHLARQPGKHNKFLLTSIQKLRLPGLVSPGVPGVPGVPVPIPSNTIPYVDHTAPFQRPLARTHPQSAGWLAAGVSELAKDQNAARFGADPVLLATDTKFYHAPWHAAALPGADLRHTAAIYARIPPAHAVAPRLLAYLTENGGERVIGLAVELLEGARFATAADLAECRAVVARLHALGVVYGPRLRRESFLVVPDGARGRTRAYLQDFVGAVVTDDAERKRAELESLPRVLAGEMDGGEGEHEGSGFGRPGRLFGPPCKGVNWSPL
ncbi:hypothetical protein B0T22DRAFT_536166 [Podospora appendiculata]|uniref:Aminoglycoside phosphotransferase domain-containing protein n=1 Tax=Podospora appendiculata TaxID=314037 RepID=A0AAE1CD89_9PEZI|nr:hypothetical protein B0T22DRAFT_536166 [Podospora appendiculata]